MRRQQAGTVRRLWITHPGLRRPAEGPDLLEERGGHMSGPMSPDALITHLVGASALILVAAHAGGWAARRLGQPYITGQLVAGMALGPSLLGGVAPGVYARLFPEEIDPALTGFAQFALVVFLFAVGYELDLKVLSDRARTT